LAWLDLAWLGLAWLGLAWLGLAWLGSIQVSETGRLNKTPISNEKNPIRFFLFFLFSSLISYFFS
jgi:hypothetical protein